MKRIAIDGAIGAVSGLMGGAGASKGNSKSAITLGKQLTKRVFNSVKYGKNEIGKAFTYYSKSIMNGAGRSIYRELKYAFIKSGTTSFVINTSKSVYGRITNG